MKTETVRTSPVAPYIDGLLEEKHANGYGYVSEEKILDRFDAYCVNHKLESVEITKTFLSDWMQRTDTEGEFNHGKRISCVRQLLLFMASCGINVYIPHDFCHFRRALPHIFENEELISFFTILDAYRPLESQPQYMHRIANEYKLLFRWYLCCGLRNSEAAGILTENVNLDTGVLTILDSKGNKDRLVYLPDDLLESTKKYYSYLTHVLNDNPVWFFPGMNPDKHILNTTIDTAFSRFWDKTPFCCCSNRPTVHDFRFSFVVSRMNLWAEKGADLQVMMPYLSRYLGHKSTNETFYYYYLVNDAYKTIKKKDTIADDVIPEVVQYE